METPDPYDEAARKMTDEELGLGPDILRYSKIKRQRVRWVWPGRLPAGKLAILDGDPDVGKSTLSLDLAARLTTGSPMPDGYDPPHPTNVLLLRAEDGAADTVLPRLLAAGADVDRFLELVSVPEVDDVGRLSSRSPELPLDVLALEETIARYEVSLVVVDPLVAFLSDWVNAHKDQQIRRALMPLAQLAERTGASILAIRHLNKTPNAPALYRGGGSIGILAAARLVLVAAQDPDRNGQRLLGVLKSNLAPKPETLAYRIVPNELYDTGQIQWHGTSKRTGSELVHCDEVDPDERSAVDEAVAFLFTVLAPGSKTATDILKEARQAGIAERTLERAKRVSGIESRKEGGPGGRWVWRLPDPEDLLEDDGE